MAVTDLEPTEPQPTFADLALPDDIRSAIEEMGYVTPTPVQLAVYEPAKQGRDLVVQARTGTGKTAAFGLPLAASIVKKQLAQVQALVLCPTRELALQVCEEVTAISRNRDLAVVAVYGGASMQRQIDQLDAGAHVLVGTPGRVLDHLRRGTLDASHVRAVVLDESDEMLSMGFLPQINDILAFLPDDHQTLLFSATLPADVHRMAETRLHDPEFLTLSGDQIGALEVDHHVFFSHGDKVRDFIAMLDVEDPESAIVFCNTREQTKRVAAALRDQGYAADWLNADLNQADREKVMAACRSGQLRFLVATDVAARGIDISHLTHVINCDFPESAESYVHRTGRTGRAGRTGTAISMVAPGDVGNLYMLRLTYGIRPIQRSIPSRRELQTRAEADLIDSLARGVLAHAIPAESIALARRLLSHPEAEALVAGLLQAHIAERAESVADATAERRARTARTTEQAQDGRDGGRRRRRSRSEPDPADERQGPDHRTRTDEGSSPAPSGESADETIEEMAAAVPSATSDAADTVELYVNVGRRDGAKPEHFLALLEAGGLPGQVAYVNVRQRHAFVGVPRSLVDQAIRAINGASISGKQAAAEEARRPGD
jgi:ATP-dependent RNA helicase DeaD